MASVERCVCCGEIIPEGRSVCPNCMVATGSGKNKKHKKRCTTDLKDLWCKILSGWIIGMASIGHMFIGLLVSFNVAGEIIGGWWFFLALAIGCMVLTFAILRYLGKGGK